MDAVVDATAVTDAEIGIEQYGGGSATDIAGGGATAVDIFDKRERHVMLDGLRRDLEHGVIGAGVDRNELNALLGEFAVELLEPRQVALHDWACIVGEHEDERPLMHRIFIADEVA